MCDRTHYQRKRSGLWYNDKLIFGEHTFGYAPGTGYIYMIRVKDEYEFGHWSEFKKNGDFENRITLWRRIWSKENDIR